MSEKSTPRIKMLIAEDSVAQANYFVQLLPQERFSIKTIHNGKEVFLYLKENGKKIDVLLLDYRMPDMNGIEILEQLRDEEKNYGTIFISADDSIDTVVKAMRAGAFDFISKHDELEQDFLKKVVKVYEYYHNKREVKKLRKELAESELKFYTAFFSNPCSMVITRFSDGVFIEVNKIFINKLGYTREEVIGLNSLELDLFIDPEQRANFRNILSQNGRIRDFEMKIKSKSGEIRVGLFSAEVIHLREEACLLSTMTDITERKQAEIELQESLELNTSLVENFLHGLIILQDGIPVYRNNNAAEILGCDGNNITSKANENWYKNIIYSEDLVVIENFLEQLHSNYSKDVNFEIRANTCDRGVIWLYMFISKITYKNNSALQLSFIDITDKKQAEHKQIKANEHADFLFQFLPLSIITVNESGKVTKCNNKTENVTGYVEQEITKMFYNQLFLKLKEYVENLTPDKFPIMNFEDKITKKSGELIDVSINLDLLSDDCPIEKGYILCFEDITEWKLNNDRIVHSEQKLKELNLTKDKFFSIIGHDLKNPFHTIGGFAELILNKDQQLEGDKLKQYISVIYNTSKAGYALLQNLLEWANSQTGKLKVEPDYFELNKLVIDNINLLGNVALQKSVNINFFPTPESKTYADQNMIQTVIRNLLSNAIKYTPRDGEIEIEIKKTDNREIIFSIKDNGQGIPSEKLESLFILNENYKSTPGTEGEDGTGLGLILCREFINKNNGHIWAESEPGKGSVFCFSLPVIKR